MTVAVHGRASLAELLGPDAVDKKADHDRDKVDTVDFGATLMALFDPQPHGQCDDTGFAAAAVSGTAATAVDSERSGPQLEGRAESRSEPRDDLPMPRTDRGSQTPSRTAVLFRPTHFQAAVSDDVFGKFHDAWPSLHGSAATSHRSDPTSSQSHEETPAGASAFNLDPATTPRSNDAANSKLDSQPASRTVFGPAIAELKVAPTIDSFVPDADISLELRKQSFSAPARDDAPAASVREFSPDRDLAKVVNPAQLDATVSGSAKAPVMRNDAVHSSNGRASDGTSPALSSQPGHRDEMNFNPAKLSQPASATLAADATASSAQLSAQTPLDSIVPMTPQPQRIRNASVKDAARQSSDTPSISPDASASVDAKPVARTSEVAAIRMTPDVTSPREPAHSVSITVQLASGETAQASVRERAGAVDVKILTPTAASAQRVSSEIDGMRQNLDAAGIKLGHSEISYQRGEGGQHGHREGYRPPAQNQSGKEVFSMSEVVE